MPFYHIRRIRFLLLIVCMFPGSVPAQIYMHNYTDAYESSAFQGNRAVDRLRRIADACLGAGNPRSLRVSAELDKTSPPSLFTVKKFPGKREIHITYPPDFWNWTRNPDRMRKLAAWIFLAKLDLGPEFADAVKDHWIIRAAARKVMLDNTRTPFLFNRNFAISYTLASHGVPPTGAVLAPPEPDGMPPALLRMNDEYAELLLDAFDRSGLLKNSVGEKLLRSELAETGMSPADSLPPGTVPDLWARESFENELFSFFTPVSVETFETRYWDAVKLPGGHAGLPAFLLAEKDKKDFPVLAREMSERLRVLSKNVPPILRNSLHKLEVAFRECVSNPGADSIETVRSRERALILETERLIELEAYLTDAQVRLVNPGARLNHLLASVRFFHAEGAALSGADALLDRWDDCR